MSATIRVVEAPSNTVVVEIDDIVTVGTTLASIVIEPTVSGPQGATGPQGEVGPPGPVGPPGGSYVFTQSLATDTWTITHNLGFFPNVTVVDSAGTVVEGTVEYLSIAQLLLTFSAAFSGVAYLS